MVIARRSVLVGLGQATAILLGLAVSIAGCGADRAGSRAVTNGSKTPAHTAPRTRPERAFSVGLRVLTLIDPGRLVRLPGRGLAPRKLVTLVRYPAMGPPARVDVVGAPAQRAAGPFPLVVFGHGFAVTPGIYARLLRAWARAGYVVAAPVFPLENANAPGAPNESDLVNQPRDMSFVISRLLAAGTDPRSTFAGLLDPRAIGIAGHSDGGETALAVAYDSHFRDPRVRAAIILSGAQIPGGGGSSFPAPSPPLLTSQGTADAVTPPSLTHAFFETAPAPKYLLTLLGAPHLGPYTDEQPQLGIVERVTIAFLDRYLKGLEGSDARLRAAGDVPATAVLHAYP